MKKILLLIVMAVATLSASAQITWNAKAGLGVAHCWGDANDMSSVFVGKIGAGIEKPFTSNWSFMPSLELALKGASEGEITAHFLYAQIPVLAAYRLNLNDDWNMTLKVGPYVGVGLYGSVSGADGDAFDYFNRVDFGLDFGLDFEYHRFVFGVEYELGFLNLASNDYASIKNAAFYATVGYKF